jgi:hypothetical protein
LSLKLLPAALLLFVVFAAGLGQTVRTADAVVTGDPVPDSNQMTSGQAPIEVVVPLDGGNEDVTVSVTGFDQPNLTGMLVVVECSPNPPDCPADLGEFTSSDADQIIVQSDGITEIILSLALTCTAEGTVTITASTVAPASSESVDVSCSPTGGGNGGGDDDHQVEVGGVYQVVATANPNILPCEGGTTTITAELVDSFGNVLANTEFRFFTTAGEIVQTSPTTAELTLGPNQYFAEVTATIPDEFDLEDVHIDEAITTVGLTCTDENLDQVLVVTANPNVIDCTGTTTLTASVRDRNGHVVPGRGFHFVTSAGLLTVSPNNASNEEGVATLSLRPGDGNATVAVSSGPLHGTFEELDGSEDIEDDFVIDETAMVTVIQNCLGTTTGQIRVNSSAQTVACGENVFIGLSVIDEDIQTVVDQTPMTLIASAGGFYGGVREDGTQNLLPAAQVPTSHGEANTIFYAPLNFHGEVKITAASGDAYGFTKLNVTCVVAPATGTGSGTGSANGGAAPPCIDIGDGVCITPPNTGRNQITPPSTGDAGLQ